MPIYHGEVLLDPISIGRVTIASIYSGEGVLRYQYDPTQILTLGSQEDFNFATWLNGQGVDPLRPIIVNIPAGEIIGSTNKANPAMDMGDLAAYTGGITINLNGEIQGAVEGDALWARQPIDIVSVGTIDGPIDDGINEGSNSIITIVVSQTGSIRSGGGNGGNGGKGGNGSSNGVWQGWQNIVGSTPAGGIGQWQQRDGFIDYNNSRQYTGSGILSSTVEYWVWGAYVYDRGWNYGSGYHEVNRAPHYYGTGGAGGGAGLGQGYNSPRTLGLAGGYGTYRSGDGGKGGDGGLWGQDGQRGATGGTGRYFSTTNSGATRRGTDGANGTPAGKAVAMLAGHLSLYTGLSLRARVLGL